jgi:hypothetical protein
MKRHDKSFMGWNEFHGDKTYLHCFQHTESKWDMKPPRLALANWQFHSSSNLKRCLYLPAGHIARLLLLIYIYIYIYIYKANRFWKTDTERILAYKLRTYTQQNSCLLLQDSAFGIFIWMFCRVSSLSTSVHVVNHALQNWRIQLRKHSPVSLQHITDP